MMNKEEIQKRIYELKTDEEIVDFVKSRISDLENNSIETTVGQGYTDSFQEYISKKTHYKAGASFDDSECPDLVYDDLTPYIELIKSIKNRKWYNELVLFTDIFYLVHDYLPSDDIGLGRALTYAGNKGKRVSIKTIKSNACAFCSEKAGMAHNLFKFLGIDSELVCGYRNGELHAYNMIYSNGYGKEPMIIYDPSFFVNFIDNNKKDSFGYFVPLRKEKYELLKSEGLEVDLSFTEKNYRNLYGSYLENMEFEGDNAIYSIGIKKEEKNIKR